MFYEDVVKEDTGTLKRDEEGAEISKFSRRVYLCFCGKYRSKRYEHIICDECGVEVQPLYQMVRSIIEADEKRNLR